MGSARRRETYSEIPHVAAEWRNCDWSSTARNAVGNAARHRSTVIAEQPLGVSYVPPESDDGKPARRQSGHRVRGDRGRP